MTFALPCFLDTSGLYALFDRAQEESASVGQAWGELIRSDTTLITTNYVLVELTALLQRRLGPEAVDALHEYALPFVEIIWIDRDLHSLAISILSGSRRRDLSLVDCASFGVMRARGLRRALALDENFAEQGFDCLPS